MSIHIEKLTPERKADFFDFFDNRAFTDHSEWAGCYCLESHLRSENDIEYRADGIAVRREDRRSVAENLIDAGIMTGYLVYNGSVPIGWCNAGDKPHMNQSFAATCLIPSKRYREKPKSFIVSI